MFAFMTFRRSDPTVPAIDGSVSGSGAWNGSPLEHGPKRFRHFTQEMPIGAAPRIHSALPQVHFLQKMMLPAENEDRTPAHAHEQVFHEGLMPCSPRSGYALLLILGRASQDLGTPFC